MQKNIIALAVAAVFSAPAFAADVNLYGIVDGAVARVANSGQKSDMLAVSGGLSGSRVGVKAVEELDGGMKAIAVLEYSLDTQTSTSDTAAGATAGIGAARQEMLALAGNFGTIATGYLQTAAYDFAAKFDPAFGSAVSPWQNMTKGNAQFLVGGVATASRAQRALAYISPSMGGVTVAFNYSTSLAGMGNLTVAGGAADTKVSAQLLSVMYTGGPLTVGGVYVKTNNPVSTNDQSEMAVGGSYDLEVAKLMGTYQSTKSGAVGASANKIMSFSGVIPVGPGAIAVSIAKATIAGTSKNGSGLTLAYLQGLSKTVTAYGALSRVGNGAGTNAFSVYNGGVAGGTSTNGASSSLLAVGLKKVF